MAGWQTVCHVELQTGCIQLQLQHGQEALMFVAQRTIIPAAEAFAEANLQNRLLLIRVAMKIYICLDPALHKLRKMP